MLLLSKTIYKFLLNFKKNIVIINLQKYYLNKQINNKQVLIDEFLLFKFIKLTKN